MSKLAEKIAKRLKDEFGLEVKPIINRSYTQTFDAGEARFFMDYTDETLHNGTFYVRFEDRAADVAKAKKLVAYYPDSHMPPGLANRELTILVEEL